MIKGIGNDILEIDRIKSAIEKNSRFLTKIYTKSELDYYQAKGEKIETLAGMFCAKEAVSKALGTGFVSFAFTDIEILRASGGKPYVLLHNKAKVALTELGGFNINISISHSKNYALAVAIIDLDIINLKYWKNSSFKV